MSSNQCFVRLTPYGEPLFEDLNPFVPRSIAVQEEKTIPRICVSVNVPGCLTALPESASSYLEDQQKRQFPFLVWLQEIPASSIPKGSLVPPQELVEKRYVPDALLTQEHWITKGGIYAPARLIRITEVAFRYETNNPFAAQTKPYEIVTSCHFEGVVTSYDRFFSYCFDKKEDAELCEALVIKRNGSIQIKKTVYWTKEEPEYCHIFMTWTIPAGENVSSIWELLYSIGRRQNSEFEEMDWDDMASNWHRLDELAGSSEL